MGSFSKLSVHHVFGQPQRQFILIPFAALILCCFIGGCGSAPEVTSEKGRKCLDAVYTAVTSKKPELLDQCRSQINTLVSQGELPQSSAEFLEETIQKASAGEWQSAAEELDYYIRRQNPR